MGSPPTELCRDSDEVQHEVTLTNAFEITRTEVTVGTYERFRPAPNRACGLACPVLDIEWRDAVAFCNALSAERGLPACYAPSGEGYDTAPDVPHGRIYECRGYRLPTDAEWEYAYRAGTTTAYYNGQNATECAGWYAHDPNLDKIGWYRSNADSTAHPVAQLQPNAWGLYDMAGNAYEWCHDTGQANLGSGPVIDPVVEWRADSEVRVARGGSWDAYAYHARAGARESSKTKVGEAAATAGFRCARTVEQ